MTDTDPSNTVDSSDIVVICHKTEPKDILLVIAKKGLFLNELRLQYTFGYEGTAQEVLLYLKDSFGWVETDRKRLKVLNRKKAELTVWVVWIEKRGGIRV